MASNPSTSYPIVSVLAPMQLFSDASQLISEQRHYSGCITVKKWSVTVGELYEETIIWLKCAQKQPCIPAGVECPTLLYGLLLMSDVCALGLKKRKKENPFQIHEIDNIASMWQWICHTRIVNKQNEVEKPFHDGFQTFPEDISQLV